MTVPKIIAQIVLTATRILGRAFIEAYKEAAINAATQGTKKGVASNTVGGMPLDEAYLILNVPKTATPQEIQSKYFHLFQQNDPKNGGSFYLQSKIFRAKERIDIKHESNANSS